MVVICFVDVDVDVVVDLRVFSTIFDVLQNDSKEILYH